MQSLTISVYISTALVKQFTASEKYDKNIQNRSVYSKKGYGVIPPIFEKVPCFYLEGCKMFSYRQRKL